MSATNSKGFEEAKGLCVNLIDTVRAEHSKMFPPQMPTASQPPIQAQPHALAHLSSRQEGNQAAGGRSSISGLAVIRMFCSIWTCMSQFCFVFLGTALYALYLYLQGGDCSIKCWQLQQCSATELPMFAENMVSAVVFRFCYLQHQHYTVTLASICLKTTGFGI